MGFLHQIRRILELPLTVRNAARQVKMHWVHRYYWKGGPEGNDIQKTNVPNLRMRFR